MVFKQNLKEFKEEKNFANNSFNIIKQKKNTSSLILNHNKLNGNLKNLCNLSKDNLNNLNEIKNQNQNQNQNKNHKSIQQLNNLNQINEIKTIKQTFILNELEKINVSNGYEFDLDLVPIDIYQSNETETPEQIVEARGYILQERLGSGAFANVYKAWHLNQHFYTACKIIEIKKKKKKRLNDLKHELYVLEKMNHVNIVKLYEYFIVDERVYIFLEYTSGGTLSEYIRKKGPVRETRAKKWFKQICSGLHHMHLNGISHRDLKLGNILLDEFRICKITDFGLSRVSYRKGLGIFYCTSYCGTEPYMSPEILKKNEYGKRYYDPLSADIWALGVCLYAMLNKAYPFNPEEKEIMIANQIQRKWKFVKRQRAKLSNDLKDLLRHLLEPDAKQRINFVGIATHPWIVNDDKINKNKFSKTIKETSTIQSNIDNINSKITTKINSNISVDHSELEKNILSYKPNKKFINLNKIVEKILPFKSFKQDNLNSCKTNQKIHFKSTFDPKN